VKNTRDGRHVPRHSAAVFSAFQEDLLSDESPVFATAGRAALLLFALLVTGLITGDLSTLLPALLGAVAAVGFAAWLEGRR
jgi:hypothetical protein